MGNSTKKPFNPNAFDIDQAIDVYRDVTGFGTSDYELIKMLDRCLYNFAQINFETDPEKFLHEGCGVIAVLLEITTLVKVKKNQELLDRYNSQAGKLKKRLQRKLQALIAKQNAIDLQSLDMEQ